MKQNLGKRREGAPYSTGGGQEEVDTEKGQDHDRRTDVATPADAGVGSRRPEDAQSPVRDRLHYMTPTGGMYGSDDSDTEEEEEDEEEIEDGERKDAEGQPRPPGDELQTGVRG